MMGATGHSNRNNDLENNKHFAETHETIFKELELLSMKEELNEKELIKLIFLKEFNPKIEVLDRISDWLADRVLLNSELNIKLKRKLKKIEEEGEKYDKIMFLRNDREALNEAAAILIEVLREKGIEFVTLPGKGTNYEFYFTTNSILTANADARLMTTLGKITRGRKLSLKKIRDLIMSFANDIKWEEVNPPGYVPLSNGLILDLVTLNLEEKLQEKYFTVKANVSLKRAHINWLKRIIKEYDWNEAEEVLLASFPNYARLYKYIFNNEHLRYQGREMLGSIFYEGVLKKAWIVVGDPDIGKSVLADVLKSALGKLASSIPLQELFSKENWKIIGVLQGKYVNITCENPETYLYATEMFKQITGDEEITGEKKYVNPFSFHNRIKLITFCNELPLFSKIDDAILDRLYIIETNAESIPPDKKDITLREKIIENELEGVFLHILLCYKELESRDFRLIYGPDRERVQLLIKERASLISDFIKDCCEVEVGYLEKGTRLYEAYLRWCREVGILKPLGRNTFYKQLIQMKFENVYRKDGIYFRGLRLKREGETTLL